MNKNKKPELYTKQYYDYFECAKYLQYTHKINDNDFWSWLCINREISNGGFITIDSYDVKYAKDESGDVLSFINKMIEEFGNDAEYLTSW